MCFVTPARVVAVAPGGAIVERSGSRFSVSLHLLDEPVAIGDFVAIQARRHAVARLTPAEAEELLALYRLIDRNLSAQR